ncbi:MAG: PAS domain S-box protein [Cytophagales bacterium]|nr:PAS domain S-box protein [Cytophagales bacterium]
MEIAKGDINVLQDELKDLKEKLRRSYKDYYDLVEKTNKNVKEVFDTSNDLISIFKPNGAFTFVNETWKKKLGYTEDDLYDMKFVNVVDPYHQKETLESLMKITAGSGLERFQTTLLTKLGKSVYVNGKLTCVFEDDRPVEYRCVFFDITDRIRAESSQALYYKIANLTIKSGNLDSLYQNIHDQLSRMLKVRNFSIGFKTPRSKVFDYAFWINEKRDESLTRDVENLLANYTMERRTPSMIYEEGIQKIANQKKVTLNDPLPKIWLGVIINIEGKPSGILSVFSYRDTAAYNNKDLELLDFISGQVSLAMERELNEETIENQAARISAIFESSTHQIWSVDRSFFFTSFNQNYADDFDEYYGMNPEVGMGLKSLKTKILSNDTRKLWKEKYEEAFEGNVVYFQLGQRTLKGKPVWRDIFVNPIFLHDGKIEEVSVIANDISEKKAAEVDLQDSEEKFRNIFESFQDIYFRCTLKGEIIMISPSSQAVLGYPTKKTLGQQIEKYFSSSESILDAFDRAINEGEVLNFEAFAKSKSGNDTPVLCNIRVINRDGKPHEIEGVARDITQLKQTNEELKKAKDVAVRSLKVKEQFLANMSHEIRTPMNGIVGMMDLMGSTHLSEEQSEYLTTIRLSSDTLLNIVNDILDLSKIEAGKMDLKLVPVQLVTTFEKIYELYSQQAHLIDNSFFYHLDKKLPEWILMDEVRLIQILSNLTSNAVKFSQKKGTINLSIRVQEQKGSNFTFKVSIKDSGIGISEEDQKKLFQSFNQLDSSSSKNYGGTGLGLAISKELVRKLGGEIGVVSTPGLGSTFWFTFKAKKTKAPSKIVKNTAPSLKTFASEKPKILLVDDNQINRSVASKILTKSGCEVIEASGGKEAVRKVKKDTFDMIFMDIQMPEMDGIEATHKLKALKLKNLPPIIAMTAYSMEEDREKFLGQGLDDYLAKPIKAEKLIQTVKKWTRFEPIEVAKEALLEQNERLVLNQNTLNQLRKFGGMELIESVLTEFDVEASTQIANADPLIKVKQFEEFRRDMHTLKGNAGTLGAEKLADIATIIEKRLKENNFEALDKFVKQLRTGLNQFKETYKNILKDQ